MALSIDRRKLMIGGAVLSASAMVGSRNAMSANVRSLWVPPEEAPHELTFMQWPVSRQVHADQEFLGVLQNTIADIANAISEFEPAVLLMGKNHQAAAKKLLSSKVEIWNIETEDLWARDSGPLFAKTRDGKRVVSHIQFNGWGNKQTHSHDGKIAQEIANRLGFDVVSSGIVGEAGGVEHDGHGLLAAHKSSWFNENRNPGLSLKEVEVRLLRAYGAEKMIWTEGVYGQDITDYHIDSLARFSGPGRVIINLPEYPDMQDPFHLAALDTYDALVDNNLDVDVIYEPSYRRIKSFDFVASYANYFVCNGAVIAAQFGDKNADKTAGETLKQHYAGREIITLNVDALGEVGGGIHCATQQLPA